MKKKILATIMMILLSMLLVGSAVAADNDLAPKNDTFSSVPRAEQTEWYFQIVNGQLQKRLWSITEGKWLTDWMDVT